MISAENAKEMAIEGFINRFNILIKDAARKGYFYILIPSTFPNSVIEYIITRGYTVTLVGDYLKISFNKPKSILCYDNDC